MRIDTGRNNIFSRGEIQLQVLFEVFSGTMKEGLMGVFIHIHSL